MTPAQPPAREAEETPQAQLTELHLDERGLEFRMKHPIVPLMAEHLAEAFKDAGGVNYVALDVNCDDIGPLVLIMQRRLGETPEMQVRRMRVELDEARAELATAQATHARQASDEPTDGNSLYYYNLWMNARIENGELREELQHEREFSRAGATAFANKEAAYASHGKAQATEVATLRATHARQADTIARLTREHAEVVARLEVMRAEVVAAKAVVRPMRCPKCGLSWVAFPPVRVDELVGTRFQPGPFVRCVECKALHSDPLDPATDEATRSGRGGNG